MSSGIKSSYRGEIKLETLTMDQQTAIDSAIISTCFRQVANHRPNSIFTNREN
jgi:hypothetical protein